MFLIKSEITPFIKKKKLNFTIANLGLCIHECKNGMFTNLGGFDIKSEIDQGTKNSILEGLTSEIMLLFNSETKPIIKEETFEMNEFCDGNFVGIHDMKNEIFESELDIKSESLQSECESGKDPLYVSLNSEKKYQEMYSMRH